MGIFGWFGQGKAAAEPVATTIDTATLPALTPEGAAHGFEWEIPTDAAQGQADALLWPHPAIAMDVGPLVDLPLPLSIQAMRDAEADCVLFVEETMDIQPTYYAKLAALAESRGADMERGNDFDMER